MDKFLWGQVYVKGALVRPPGAHDNSNDHYQQAMVPTCWNCEGVLWLIFCDALVKDDQHLEDRLGVDPGEPCVRDRGDSRPRYSGVQDDGRSSGDPETPGHRSQENGARVAELMFFFVTREVRMFSDETWKIMWVSILANLVFFGITLPLLGKMLS